MKFVPLSRPPCPLYGVPSEGVPPPGAGEGRAVWAFSGDAGRLFRSAVRVGDVDHKISRLAVEALAQGFYRLG